MAVEKIICWQSDEFRDLSTHPVPLTMKTAQINSELTTQPPVSFFPLVFRKWNHKKLARPKANHVEKSDETNRPEYRLGGRLITRSLPSIAYQW